jgi:hypothetical protein
MCSKGIPLANERFFSAIKLIIHLDYLLFLFNLVFYNQFSTENQDKKVLDDEIDMNMRLSRVCEKQIPFDYFMVS